VFNFRGLNIWIYLHICIEALLNIIEEVRELQVALIESMCVCVLRERECMRVSLCVGERVV